MAFNKCECFDGQTVITAKMMNDIQDAICDLEEKVGSGGADWNAAEGESGHVRNRTHWVEGGITEVLPETQLLIYNNESNEAFIADPFNLTIGENYIVNISGEEYRCNCVDGGLYDEAYTGVPGLINEGADLSTGIGLIFGVLCFPEPMQGVIHGAVIFANRPAEATISIYHNGETVHQLDSKFLPVLVVQFEEREDGSLVSRSHSYQQMLHAIVQGIPVACFIRYHNGYGSTAIFGCSNGDSWIRGARDGEYWWRGWEYTKYYLDGDTSNKTIGNELWGKN